MERKSKTYIANGWNFGLEKEWGEKHTHKYKRKMKNEQNEKR